MGTFSTAPRTGCWLSAVAILEGMSDSLTALFPFRDTPSMMHPVMSGRLHGGGLYCVERQPAEAKAKAIAAAARERVTVGPEGSYYARRGVSAAFRAGAGSRSGGA